MNVGRHPVGVQGLVLLKRGGFGREASWVCDFYFLFEGVGTSGFGFVGQDVGSRV